MDKYLQIKELFEKHSDPEKAVGMSKYMRDLFPFYGIPAPERKTLYKEFLKNEKRLKTVDWNLLNKCYDDEHREFQYFVYDYLITMKKHLVYEDIEQIRVYIQNKSWWDTIDFFHKIIGEIGISDKRADELMLKWSTDENFWIRRVSIDFQLGRKEKTDTELLEKIILNNLGSREFFINKAIGWSLRDYSKTDPQWVKNFIERNEDRMARLSITEAGKYLKK